MIDVAALILRNAQKFETSESTQAPLKGDDRPGFAEFLDKAISSDSKNPESSVQPDNNKLQNNNPPEAPRAEDKNLQKDEPVGKTDADNNQAAAGKPLSEDERAKLLSGLKKLSTRDIKIQASGTDAAEKKIDKSKNIQAENPVKLAALKKEMPAEKTAGAAAVETAVPVKEKNKILHEINQLIETAAALLAAPVIADKNVKNEKTSAPELSEKMNAKQTKGPLELLSQKLSELRSLADKKPDAGAKPENISDQRNEALAKKITAVIKQTAQALAQPQGEIRPAALNELTAKLAEIIEALKPSSDERRADRAADREGGITFNFFKNDGGVSARRVSAAQTPSDIARFKDQYDGIVDHAKLAVRDGKNATFVMKMYPRELGGVGVNLGLEGGVISGRFMVDSDEAKQILMNNLSDLKERLESEGVSVGSFEVDVSGRGRESFAGMENDGRVKLTARESADAAADYDSMGILGGNENLREGSINLVI